MTNVSTSRSLAEKVKRRTSTGSEAASVARLILVGGYARLSVVIAACILTFHGVFLTFGSVLVWHKSIVWLVALPIGFMDLILLAKLFRPVNAKDWW
jgi:hypothetical protein